MSDSSEKERKLSLILTPETQKFWVSNLGFFNSRDKESSVARRVGQLETN